MSSKARGQASPPLLAQGKDNKAQAGGNSRKPSRGALYPGFSVCFELKHTISFNLSIALQLVWEGESPPIKFQLYAIARHRQNP